MKRAARFGLAVLLGLALLIAWLVLRASPSGVGRLRDESLAAEPSHPVSDVLPSLEGGRTPTSSVVDVEGAASPAPIQPARTLGGRILVGDVPIDAGVEVGAELPAAGVRVVHTTEGGAFRFENLPPRPLRLTLPQRYRLRDASWPATIEWAGAWVVVPEHVDAIEIRCSLEPGLHGRILDEAGAAVAAAVLVPEIRWIGGGSRGGELESRADGRFEIPRVDPAEVSAFTLRVSHPSAGFSDLALPGKRLPADGDLGDLVLARGLTLRFQASGAGGQPLAGAIGSTDRQTSPPTAADGRAAFLLSPSASELRVDCDGYLPAFVPLAGYRGEELLIRLMAAARLELEFLLPEDVQPVSARLRLAVPEGQLLFEGEDRPGQEGRRFAPPRWCRTQTAGGRVWRLESGLRRDRRVAVNGLAIGAPINLSLHQAGVLHERILAPFAPGERRQLTIDLSDSGLPLWGRVIDETGVPVAGAMLSVGDDSGSSSGHADDRGEFRVGPFAASRLHVRVLADGYQTREFEIPVGAADRCHEFVLARARAVRLELRDPGGHLIEVSPVRLPGEWEPAEPAGTFTLLGLPLEAAPIAVEIQGVRFAGTVPAGANHFVLTLAGVGVAEIRTHGLQEFAASPAVMLLRVVRLDPPGAPLFLRATPRARYALLAGTYRVEVVEDDRHRLEPDRSRVVGGPVGLHVAAGATAVIELEAEP